MSSIRTGSTAAMSLPRDEERGDTPETAEKSMQNDTKGGIRQRVWGLEARLDPTVTFEEFQFWAKIERELEEVEYLEHKEAADHRNFWGFVTSPFRKSSKGSQQVLTGQEQVLQERELQAQEESAHDGKVKPEGASPSNTSVAQPEGTHVTDAEWRHAARALRTASYSTIFFLITVDILGWSQTPFVFASVGYGLGVGIFVLFGLAAGAAGWMVWRIFLGLDSARYPVLTFGDPALRIFGPKSRHFINVTQAFQMFCSVAVVLMGQSQLLSQLTNGKICFPVVLIIIMVIGMAFGVIRSLQHLGWLCNMGVWLNVISFIIICVAAALKGPDPTVALQTTLLKKLEPIKTFIGTPPAEYQQQSTNIFAAQFNGIDTIVYAYAGVIFFFAFLSEMRRPMDFWKGCFFAQAFITVVYIFFGAFTYTYVGQYSITNITQVTAPYGIQVANNILALLTGFLSIFLYFNIGFKTVYIEIGQELLNLPPISTNRGRWLWYALGPVYWILAFVVSASVPNFTGITNLIGAILSLNFTYSIPALMFVAYQVHVSAALPGEGFDPYTGVTTRHDEGWRRWVRGFCKGWYITVPTLLFALGGLASSGMGTWSAILGLQEVFGPGGTIQSSWGCAGPG